MIKTITMTQFEAFIKNGIWTRSQHHKMIEQFNLSDLFFDENGDCTLREVPHLVGEVSLISCCNEVTITYTEDYEYDLYKPDSFSHATNDLIEGWEIKGVCVLDENGDVLPISYLISYLTNAFSKIDYSQLMQTS